MNKDKKIQEINLTYDKVEEIIKQSRYDEATKIINKLYQESIELNYENGIDLFHEKYILILFYTFENYQAIPYLQNLIEVFKDKNQNCKLARLYNLYGTILYRMKDYNNAQFYLEKALKTKTTNPERLVSTNFTLAMNAYGQKNIDGAINYLDEGLKYIEIYFENNIARKFYLKLFKADLLIQLDKIEEAKIIFTEIEKNKTRHNKFAFPHFNKLKIDFLLKEPIIDKNSFLKLINTTLKKSLEIKDKELTMKLLNVLKDYHYSINEIDLAYKYAVGIIEKVQAEKNKQTTIISNYLKLNSLN